MDLKTLNDIKDLEGKKVLVRIDTDVEIIDGKIIDDSRLKSCLLTIDYLLKNKAKIILVGHLGRPTNKFPISNFQFPIKENLKEFSLEHVARWFAQKLKGERKEDAIGDFVGWQILDRLSLLENIRFYEGEEDLSASSGQVLAKKLAEIADIFVNEAFAVTHRKHASTYGITKFLPSYAGLHLKEEVEILDKVLKNPKRPLVVIIGGAKIETKLPLVSAMHKIADYVLVGGKIAEQERILIKVQHEKIEGHKSMVLVADNKQTGDDITDKSAENFIQVINIASTVVWNGPVGLIDLKDKKDSEKGTREVANAIIESHAYSVIGGGDTVAFLKQLNLLDKFSFVSTGGGAMLEFMSGEKLPALIPLIKKQERYSIL